MHEKSGIHAELCVYCAFIVRLLSGYCAVIVRCGRVTVSVIFVTRIPGYQDTRIPGNRVAGVEVIEVGGWRSGRVREVGG